MSAARGAGLLARAALVATAVAAVLVSGVRPASADILAPADAKELAALLDEAYQQQGVCYGWRVSLDDNYNVPSKGGTFTGSNFGAGTRVTGDPRCAKLVIFTAQLTYTSSASESEDSATWFIETNIPGADSSDLRSRVLLDDDALVGDRDDVALFNAVASLPIAVAEAGLAPPLRPDANVGDPPGNAHLTGSPGSDFLRTRGTTLFIFGGLLLLGVLWLIFAVSRRNQRGPATGRSAGPSGAPPWRDPPAQGPGPTGTMSPPGQPYRSPPPGRHPPTGPPQWRQPPRPPRGKPPP